MSQMLAGLPGTVCMMDDVLVYGATQEEHDLHLKMFSSNHVKFLGYIVDEIGIHPDPEKIQGIVQTTTPQDVSDPSGNC